MTTLTDRYVAAVVAGLPAQQRPDVELELRASVADAIDARTAVGSDAAVAEREVLTDLGDPARLAATYAERPLFLIGPINFPGYRRLLLLLLAIAVPIVAIVVAIDEATSDASVGELIGATIWASIETTVHVAFWTTLVFVILDRFGAVRRRPLVAWDLDTLPQPSTRPLQFGETVMGVIGYGMIIGSLVWQQLFFVVRDDAGDRLPFLNPDLWSFWLPFLLVVLAGEMVFTVATYRQGVWSRMSAIVNLGLSALFAIPVAVLAARGDLLNPAFFDHLGWPEGSDAGSVVSVIFILSVIGISVWDSIEGFRRVNPSRTDARPLVLV